MKRFCWLVFFLVSGAAWCQPISMVKTFGSVRYERDTLILSARQVSDLLYHNTEAYNEFRVARTNNTVGTLLGFTGGVLVGFPIGTALAGGQPEWGLAAGGAALILASIPFNRAFTKRAGNAIDIYNGSLKASHRWKAQMQWRGTVAALRITF